MSNLLEGVKNLNPSPSFLYDHNDSETSNLELWVSLDAVQSALEIEYPDSVVELLQQAETALKNAMSKLSSEEA